LGGDGNMKSIENIVVLSYKTDPFIGGFENCNVKVDIAVDFRGMPIPEGTTEEYVAEAIKKFYGDAPKVLASHILISQMLRCEDPSTSDHMEEMFRKYLKLIESTFVFFLRRELEKDE